MRSFLQKFCFFTLPILITGICIEVLIRHIPNDYSYKREYLDRNAAEVEILFLGSSHAYRDINPVYIDAVGFNGAYVSQTLEYDYKILEKYEDDWSSLKYIIVSVSYFSLFNKQEKQLEAWRIKNYSIYYSMWTTYNIADYFELLSNRLDINCERIYSYYWLGQTNITSTPLGWGMRNSLNAGVDLVEDGKATAKRHTANGDVYFDENVGILKSIIAFADKRNVQVIFYTPPAYKTYIENLDETQLSRTISTMEMLAYSYPNVIYKNYLTSDLLGQEDFYDADHLNEIGAKKFTLEIERLIRDQK